VRDLKATIARSGGVGKDKLRFVYVGDDQTDQSTPLSGEKALMPGNPLPEISTFIGRPVREVERSAVNRDERSTLALPYAVFNPHLLPTSFATL
jgi:hypothetical protein